MKDLRNEDQEYNARLNWTLTRNCNLNCSYCLRCNHLIKYKFSLKIPEINISALIQVLDKTKKIFRINFTGGGEPFLVPNIVDACIEITKKHYISIISNLTSESIKEFSEKIDPKRVINIFASLHIKELERLNLFDKFIDNLILCKEKGFKIFVCEVAHPLLLKEVKIYQKYFTENGFELSFIPYRGYHNEKKYPESYTENEINIFGLNVSKFYIWYQKGNLCNAGYNVCMVDPDGNIRSCTKIRKIIGNIYEKIQFNDKLIRCPFEFCLCPVNVRDPFLFNKALRETYSETIDPGILKNFVKE